ncbi:MAG: hypothetical protein GY711_05225 [bacterium]|nr:hypothetical protein [bacterium]
MRSVPSRSARIVLLTVVAALAFVSTSPAALAQSWGNRRVARLRFLPGSTPGLVDVQVTWAVTGYDLVPGYDLGTDLRLFLDDVESAAPIEVPFTAPQGVPTPPDPTGCPVALPCGGSCSPWNKYEGTPMSTIDNGICGFDPGAPVPCVCECETFDTFQSLVIQLGQTIKALLDERPGSAPDGTQLDNVLEVAYPFASYCPALPNSTGQPGRIAAAGSAVVAHEDLSLIASDLPPGQFGYFLTSQTPGMFQPPGSSGIICLSGNLGRFSQPALVIQGPTGSIALDLDSMPVNPTMPVLPGASWYYQCWYRDIGNTNNFTDAVQVTFS